MSSPTSTRVALVFSLFCLTTRDVGADPVGNSVGNPATIQSDSSSKPVDFLLGIRVGFTENPRLESVSDNRNSASRAGIVGAQVTVVHERHFTLGFGLEHLATGYTHFREDTLSGMVEDNQFSSWLLYVSPGVHSRLGKDQPLGFGLNVDAGFLWVREDFLTHDISSSWGDRIGAIRPKAVATYDISPGMFLQFESGWLWAEKTGYRVYYDYFDGSSDGYAWELDFTGPYIASMLTIRLPRHSRPESDFVGHEAGPTQVKSGLRFVAGLRGGVIAADVDVQPTRWDFDGDYGSPASRGLQASIITPEKFELGLGFELFGTHYSDTRDTIFGEQLRSAATYLYATFAYEGLWTPVMSVPLGLGLDVGHIWARESVRSGTLSWYGSRSTELEGNAARLKFTISPRLARPVGLRFEVGWMFASLGSQIPPPQPMYRREWEAPSAMDFSGLSVVAMVRLMSQ